MRGLVKCDRLPLAHPTTHALTLFSTSAHQKRGAVTISNEQCGLEIWNKRNMLRNQTHRGASPRNGRLCALHDIVDADLDVVYGRASEDVGLFILRRDTREEEGGEEEHCGVEVFVAFPRRGGTVEAMRMVVKRREERGRR